MKVNHPSNDVFFVISGCEDLGECFMDVEVLPFFRRSWHGTLKSLLASFISEFFDRDRVIHDLLKVALREDEHSRLVALNFVDLVSPSINAIEGGSRVGGDANHEAIGVLVLDTPVDVEVLVA